MTRLTIDDAALTFHFSGLDMVWSLKRTLRIPRALVRAARVERIRLQELSGFRLYGTYFPRVIAAGTFTGDVRRNFYCVRQGRDALVLELSGGPYERCAVQLADAQDALSRMQRAS